MVRTVVVEKDGIEKIIPEEYKKDFIIAGWREVEKKDIETPTPVNYDYNAKL